MVISETLTYLKRAAGSLAKEMSRGVYRLHSLKLVGTSQTNKVVLTPACYGP